MKRIILLIVVATFVDFDCFEIPDEVSIGGMLLAPLCALLVPVLHSDTVIAQARARQAAAEAAEHEPQDLAGHLGRIVDEIVAEGRLGTCAPRKA